MLLQLIILVLVLNISVSNGRSPPMPPAPPTRFCQKKLDLAFIIDASRTINEKDFDRQKQFVIDIIDHLDIGEDKTKVAAVTFHKHVYKQFLLNEFSTKEQMKDAIASIKYDREGTATRTYKALEYVNSKIFNPGNGERKDAEDVVVVLTDGKTNSGSVDDLYGDLGPKQTQIEAASLKERPAHIFAIGVGSQTDEAELNGISSDPDDIYTIQVGSFKELDSTRIKDMLINRTCMNNIQPNCTDTVADVFFLIDESASLSYDRYFKKEIDFAISVVDLLNIGPGKTQVGAMTFGEGANVEFYLNEANTREDIAKKLSQITWGAAKGTQLDDAFRLLRTNGLNRMYGSRPNVPQIAIIITDGKSTDPKDTKDELVKLHEQNYILFAIGVGPRKDIHELNLIAGDPSHVFPVDDLNALAGIRHSVAERVCNQGISASDLARKPDKAKQWK